MSEVEYKSEFESTKDTLQLAMTGELWIVFCEDFGQNRPPYIGTALYIVVDIKDAPQQPCDRK